MTTDDLPECPLCMVELFYDDLGFYPCSCGYQICRFCWSKILNEENGLCPACRGPYDSEAPASFTPLSEEQFQKLKKEKRNKERKNKTVENRKHLADIRVVQKNLAFVIGLPQRFADNPETLKGPEYFGKYGKVFKVVVNRNAAQPGSQGQGTAGAYVTFVRSEDTIRAILDLNKQQMEGRTLKASLGTTKYCSQFLKGATCTKHECMYLHELGEEAASFTKEEMQQNKHTEYERKLIDEFTEQNASIERSLLLSASSQHHQQHSQSGNPDSNHHRQAHVSECRDHSSSSSNSNSNTPPASRRATKSESQTAAPKYSQQSGARNQHQQQHRSSQSTSSAHSQASSSANDCPSQRTPRKTSQPHAHKPQMHHQTSQSRQSPPQQHMQQQLFQQQRIKQPQQQLQSQSLQQQQQRKASQTEETAHQPLLSSDDDHKQLQVQLNDPQHQQASQPQQHQLEQQQLHLQQQQLQILQQQLQQKQKQHHHQQLQQSLQQQQQEGQMAASDAEASMGRAPLAMSAPLHVPCSIPGVLSALPPGRSVALEASHHHHPGGCGPLGDSDQLQSGGTSTAGSVSSSSASLHHLSSLSLPTSSSVLNGLNSNYSLPPLYSLQFLQEHQHQQQQHQQYQQSDMPSFDAHRLARSASLTEKSSDGISDCNPLSTEHQYQSLNRSSRWPTTVSSAHDSPAEVMFCPKDDEASLDFDPVKESQQGLAALIEHERTLPGGAGASTSAAAAYLNTGGHAQMAPPPGFEMAPFGAPMRASVLRPSSMSACHADMMPNFSFFPGNLGPRLASAIEMSVHSGDSTSESASVPRHMPSHSQTLGISPHMGIAAAQSYASSATPTSPDLSFSVKALEDTLRCILPEETTITFDPSLMRDMQPTPRGTPQASTLSTTIPANMNSSVASETVAPSTTAKELSSIWPRNGFRLDDDPAVLASGRDAVHPIQTEFNPFWPASPSNLKSNRAENEIGLRSEMVWSSPTTPPGFGSSVLSLLGGLGNGSATVDVDGQRAVNVDRHTSVTATGDQQISNQL